MRLLLAGCCCCCWSDGTAARAPGPAGIRLAVGGPAADGGASIVPSTFLFFFLSDCGARREVPRLTGRPPVPAGRCQPRSLVLLPTASAAAAPPPPWLLARRGLSGDRCPPRSRVMRAVRRGGRGPGLQELSPAVRRAGSVGCAQGVQPDSACLTVSPVQPFGPVRANKRCPARLPLLLRGCGTTSGYVCTYANSLIKREARETCGEHAAERQTEIWAPPRAQVSECARGCAGALQVYIVHLAIVSSCREHRQPLGIPTLVFQPHTRKCCSAGWVERPCCWPTARERPCCKGFAGSSGRVALPLPPPRRRSLAPLSGWACAGTRS